MEISKKSGGKLYLWISIISILAIVLLLNLIAQLFPIKLDFSEGKRYSIGEDTKAVLGGLERDVTIYGLFDDGKADRDYLEIRELLENYAVQSEGRIRVEFIDPDRDTGIIARLDPEGLAGLRKNDFYITDGTRGKKLGYQDLFKMEYDQKTSTWFNTGSSAELSFTSAIQDVGATQKDVIYLVSDEPDAYGAFTKELQKAGKTIKTLSPDDINIPADAAVLLFFAPQEDLTEDFENRLSEYLDAGGSAGVFFNAVTDNKKFPLWDKLLADFSLELEYNSLFYSYSERHLPDDNGALLLDVPESDVVPLEFYGLLLPDAQGIRVLEDGQASVTVLAKTGDSTVDASRSVISKFARLPLAKPESSAADTSGTRDVVAVSERGGAKLLLSGSASFLSDATKDTHAPYFVTGLYFATSVLDWLEKSDEGSTIETRIYDRGELQIPLYKANYIAFLTVILLPLAIFGRGFIVWRRRRYL